jgi:hypothetical protein
MGLRGVLHHQAFSTNTFFLREISFRRSLIFLILASLAFLYFICASPRLTSINVNSRYSYYVCTQIYNESEHYLIEWLDHQFNVIGFKNVCLINVGQPLSTILRKQFPFAYIEKKNLEQEFDYCLSSCFVDKPMRPEDMLMIQDIDEYLNVRTPDEIFKNYDKYNQFHFIDTRYGNLNSFDKSYFLFMLLFRLRQRYR